MTTGNAGGKRHEVAGNVMVKGYQDGPSHLLLHGDGGEVVVVKSLTTDATIGLQREWVFRWDEDLFSRLSEAYERSDSEALSELWGRAEPLSS